MEAFCNMALVAANMIFMMGQMTGSSPILPPSSTVRARALLLSFVSAILVQFSFPITVELSDGYNQGFFICNTTLEPVDLDGLTLMKGRGLKLWEGSLDLVKTLRSEVEFKNLSLDGKKVLEVGPYS
ncbi:hypothetical protein L1887_18761 [Cichorium endivia]|nr:hypothetical protein L1887_18761 [Cichorium endivia]